MTRVRIAVVGAGLIGRRHIALVGSDAGSELVSVVDPDPAAREGHGVPGYAGVPEMLAAVRPDAVIVASPNRLHVEHVLHCVEAQIPVLVEKPIADSPAEAASMVAAAESAGVPLLVGHHRRHSPVVAAAAEAVRTGVLGRLVAVRGSALFRKPDGYFDEAPWRSTAGGGPILINLVHEIDNLRALCGEVTEVQAMASNGVRGFDVEDTAAVTLRFGAGALGVFLLSDVAAAPHSWEQTSAEDPAYPNHPDEDCYVLAGTDGSLGIPTMRLRVFSGERSWWQPFRTSVLARSGADPLVRQLAHFWAVVRGETAPLVDGREGLRTLRVTHAVAEAARTGTTVPIPLTEVEPCTKG
ncbi:MULTISPECIES: Gfo/Idh/MocA family protein [Prauserella salsuginis group]|uniref:Gfo/Idh/MocA family protein n=1 Tax=Prauserella salsuginis TaxID=387889 RepID=A0ABW6G122_9PSEU|nr:MULTISPECIES: Gfo/Idh/MocA family oxidoreductase [Prauserella salsuginis group]MCR3722050.1 putative dehydrogenase [Prauserella flava]MCR3732631.1 putative dehydrogenase [Prauserella salsuginis]